MDDVPPGAVRAVVPASLVLPFAALIAPAVGWALAVFALPSGSSAGAYAGVSFAVPAALALCFGLLLRTRWLAVWLAVIATLGGAIAWIVTIVLLARAGVFRS